MLEKLADYHIHTSFCNHANGTMKDYVKFAITAGLKEIGFSDHCPLPANFDSHFRMFHGDLQIYLNTIKELQKQFPQLTIKVGIELDYIEGAENFLKQFIAENGFDYIIGSVHYLNIDSDHQAVYLNDLHSDNKAELFFKYFETVKKAVATGLFDIIAHFDLPRRFWGELDSESISYANQTLELIKAFGICLEINTSGYRTKNVEEPFPGNQLLSLARKRGIPVTLGSDSHSPCYVGSFFAEALILLKKVGFTEIYFFSQRKKHSVLI